MRKAIVCLLVLLGMVAFLFVTFRLAPAASEPAETSAEVKPEEIKGSPKIVFEERTHDFGAVDQDQTVKYDFKFKNAGDAPLVIGNIRTTCGCTGTLLSKKELAPGEEGDVEVSFHTPRSGGQKKKSIFVNSNDPQQPSVQLDITAKVLVSVEVKPPMLYWVAERNKESMKTIEVLYNPEIKLNIKKLEFTSPAFTASVKPKNDPEFPGYDISVKYDGTLPPGRFQQKLTIATDNPKYPNLVAYLRGKVVGPVKVVPDSISLGVVRDEALPTRIIRVYDTNKDDFKVTEVKSSNPIISVELTKEAANRYEVKATLKAKPPQGAFSEKLLIKTNDPTETIIEVPVYAIVN